MTTVWYWIKNAPPTRPGGPWWHQTFDSAAKRERFIRDMRPFVRCFAICGETPAKEQTHPPITAEIVYTKDGRMGQWEQP